MSHPLNRTTCEEAFRRLDDFLDRRLARAEMHLIEEHLEICAACAREFTFEASVLNGSATEAASAQHAAGSAGPYHRGDPRGTGGRLELATRAGARGAERRELLAFEAHPPQQLLRQVLQPVAQRRQVDGGLPSSISSVSSPRARESVGHRAITRLRQQRRREVRIRQLDAVQHREGEIGMPQRGPRQIHRVEQRAHQHRVAQVGAAQPWSS